VDLLLNSGFVNYLIGGLYLVSSLGFGYLICQIMKATPQEYSFITSKKSNFVNLFYLILATSATVAYQNFSGDDHVFLLWWRAFLIASIAGRAWGS